MVEEIAAADLIVCRSGASTVAELAAAGRPSILVPFAAAADDHQRKNADVLVAAGAAERITEAHLTPDRLLQTITTLLAEDASRRNMAAAARNAGPRERRPPHRLDLPEPHAKAKGEPLIRLASPA